MRKWKLGLLLAAAVAAVAAAVAIASAAASGTTTSSSEAVNAVPTPNATPTAAGHPDGQWQQLMKNKAFRDEYFALRRTQLDDQQAWWDKYASDPQGSAAQTAWNDLRQKEQSAMQALLKKYGFTVPTAPQGLQQLQKLKDNAKFRADAAKLGDQFKADMQTWFKQFGANPRSTQAKAAMDKLRTKYESDVKALLEKYGVTTSGDLPLGILGHGLMGGGHGGGWFGDGLMGGGGRGGFDSGLGGAGGLGGMMDGGSPPSGVPAI